MESGEEEPTLPPEMGKVLSQMTQVLTQMQQNQDLGSNGNARVSIREFLELKPRTFDTSSEPLDADDWLREMNRTLTVAHVADEDRVPYVTYLLRGQSMSWWENFQAMRAPGMPITWERFKEAFLNHHIPDGLMERMSEEFISLTQGNMDVLEYQREFNRLARYAGDEISTEARKMAKFRRGFNPELKYALTNFKAKNFEELINIALNEEHGRKLVEESRKHSREETTSSKALTPPQK